MDFDYLCQVSGGLYDYITDRMETSFWRAAKMAVWIMWVAVKFLVTHYVFTSCLLLAWGLDLPLWQFAVFLVYSIKYQPEIIVPVVDDPGIDFSVFWPVIGVVVAVMAIITWICLLIRFMRKPALPNTGIGFHFERFVEGSNFMPMKMPTFCVKIFIQVGGKWYHSGIGFRTSHGLLTAAHVIVGADRVRFESNTNTKEVDPGDFETTKIGDVSVYRNINVLAGLGTTVAKLSKVALSLRDREMVMATNGEYVSLGPLSGAEEFGFVNYGGSTVKGFSGSPYYINNTVFGLHTGSSTVNFGYASGYMEVCLSVLESTEDYVYDMVRRKRRGVRCKISPYDTDEMCVEIGGRFFMMDRARYLEAQQDEEDPDPDGDAMIDDFIADDENDRERMRRERERRVRRRRPVQIETAAPAAVPVAQRRAEQRVVAESAAFQEMYQDHAPPPISEPAVVASGNASRPAVLVTEPAGRSCSQPDQTVAALLSGIQNLVMESRRPQTTRMARTTAQPASTVAPSSQASASTSSNTAVSRMSKIARRNAQVRDLQAQVVSLQNMLNTQQSTS